MKRGRSALPLPRYTLRKRITNGWSYFFNIQVGHASEAFHCRMDHSVPTTTERYSGSKEFCSRHLIAGVPVERTRPWSSEHWTRCFTNIAERGRRKRPSGCNP